MNGKQLNIVKYPDPRLRAVCKPVEEDEFGSDHLLEQAADMIHTMYVNGGIGLAANQVDYTNRVIVVAMSPEDFPDSNPTILVNPRIVSKSSGKVNLKEGCLSFPGRSSWRRRSKSVIVEYQDVLGGEHKWRATGLAAVCVQHEIDHLNGKTFIDR